MKEVVGGFGRDVVKNNGVEGITQQNTGDCIGDGFGGGISDGFGNGQRSVVKS